MFYAVSKSIQTNWNLIVGSMVSQCNNIEKVVHPWSKHLNQVGTAHKYSVDVLSLLLFKSPFDNTLHHNYSVAHAKP